MHAHSVLMLAAVVVVWLFVGVVVGVTWLQRRGRLGAADRLLAFDAYGPVLVAACSAGAAGVRLTVVGEHAVRTGATVSSGAGSAAITFLCSVGAGGAQFSVADATIVGFLPLGILSLLLLVVQAAFGVPHAWRNPILAVVGLTVTLGSIAVSVVPRLIGIPSGLGTVVVPAMDYSDALSVVLEVIAVGIVGLLVFRRPRRLLERLRIKVADAYVGTALSVGAVVVFAVAGVFLGHAVH